MQQIFEGSGKVQSWLEEHYHLKWMRCKLLEEIKCDVITNNVAKVWNNWVKDLKDLPITDIANALGAKFMEPYAKR